MTRIAALFVAASAFAQQAFCQHAVAPPQLGFIQDGSRELRPLYGIAGNFILGPAVRGPVVSQAFSGSLGLLKTGSLLAAFNRQGESLGAIDVSGGPALFAFSPNGTTALSYIPSSNALYQWKGGAFSRSWLRPVEGTVLAIAYPTALEAALIVERNADSVWEIHVPLGGLGTLFDGLGTLSERALTGVRAPVLALPSGDLVYTGVSGIVVRHATGVEIRIPAALPASFSLQQMNQDWVELTDSKTSARFALRAIPSREGIYRLPE